MDNPPDISSYYNPYREHLDRFPAINGAMSGVWKHHKAMYQKLADEWDKKNIEKISGAKHLAYIPIPPLP